MRLKCGIVGLPNVGKSTLFNALTASNNAQAANYPFCTIEPNTGVVTVPDDRLENLAKCAASAKIIPAFIEFVDIAGLVRGASKGEGLGNQFLSHIREVDAIIHVLRCFEDADITHVHGKIDPVEDAEVIETELIIADLDSVEKRLPNMIKKAKTDKLLQEQVNLMEICRETLAKGFPLRVLNDKVDKKLLASLQLLTSKPVLYVCNVLEDEAKNGNAHSDRIIQKATKENANVVIISSKIEAEIALLESQEEKLDFLQSVGIEETGLSKIIKSAYSLLGLSSFFTIGPKEAHAWTFETGTSAPAAAGIIHTDFEKGFIRAEVISCKEYLELGGEVKAKELGKLRVEGKEYIMQDGDVVHFRFNV
ncbi:MAG: redox-regulated ATPase YchF [Rickettsiales bacterium]|nr:redox-regulated ATPase YchF [Rickettsiales bacterium]MCA0254120.1 redox-regulated ATPase YchF [Pseudomonadota bacterium]